MLSGVFSDTLFAVRRAVEDKHGRLWVIRMREGIRELSLLTRGDNGEYEVTMLPLRRANDVAPFWSIYPDPRDSEVLWLGGDEGVLRVDTGVDKNETISFQALIRRVMLHGDSLLYAGSGYHPQAEHQTMLPLKSRIRFEYAAANYDAPSWTRYQYKLEGFDEEWSTWTNETVKEYTNLLAGSYQFHVRANNIYGHISESDTYVFGIQAPWYQTWWAYFLFVIPVALGLIMFVRFQRVRVIRKERLRSEVEQARLRTSAAELQTRNLQAENELLYSELRFLSVVESANDAIVSANQEGDIIFWNKQAEQVFGYPREEALGQPLTILMPERHVESHEKGLQRHIQTGEKSAIGRVIELSGKRKDGTEFPLELSLSSWKTDEGIFFSAILRDITEQKRAEAELIRMQNQLAHSNKMASLGKLTAGIAHEIRNPLNFVNNFAQMMMDLVDEAGDLISKNSERTVKDIDGDLSETFSEIKRNAAAINKHGHRADLIIKSMMDHSRNSTGDHHWTPLNELVDTAIQLSYENWQREQPGFDIEIVRTLGSSVGEVKVAPQEITRVLLNILDNAYDAMHSHAVENKGSLTPTVLVHTIRKEDAVEIHIRDNGPGIELEVKEHIFDPFFTTKPAGSGTGLGLSLSYDIITQGHSGFLTCESTPGEGTTFVIGLPV